LAPQRESASSRERKEKTAYKNRLGAHTLKELCPLDPTVIGLELVSTSTLLSITSQDIINNTPSEIKTLLTKPQKARFEVFFGLDPVHFMQIQRASRPALFGFILIYQVFI
jgi:hypothetical protein